MTGRPGSRQASPHLSACKGIFAWPQNAGCIFISTFFLLFVVQSSQNADTEAIQDKLDEIIDSLPTADRTKEGEEKKIKRGEKE